MATPTIRDRRTLLYNADSGEATSWDNGGYMDSGMREGTHCLGDIIGIATQVNIGTLPAAVNVENNHIGAWIRPGTTVDTKAAGGLRIGVQDAGGNYYDWYVGGNDSPGVGSWLYFVINTNRPPDGSSGTPDLTAITDIRITFKPITKAVGNSQNCFWDAAHLGERMDICGGTPSDPLTWADISAEIESYASGKAYGNVRRISNGIFALRGWINCGDGASGTVSTHIEDVGVNLFYENDLSEVDYHKLTVEGDPNVTTFVKFGDSVGAGEDKQGLSGLSILSSSEVSPLEVLFMDNAIAFELNGCTFSNLQEAVFGSGTPLNPLTTGVQMLDNAFNEIGWIVRNIESTGTLQRRNTVVAATGTLYGMRILDGQGYDGEDWSLIQTRGLTSASGIFESQDYESIQALRDFTMEIEGQYVEFINPVWGPSGTPLLTWDGETGTFLEEFDYKIRTADPAATAIENARVYIFDDYDAVPASADFQIITGSTDAQGDFADVLIQQEWIDDPPHGSGSVHGAFDERILKFGRNPFEAAFDLGVIQAAIDKGVTLTTDGGVELSEAAADLVSGTVYEHGTGTAGGNLIAFDNGTILFAADDVVVGASSGATGTVRDKTGDAADGTIFIVDRNAIAFQDGEDLDVVGATNATANLTSGTGGVDIDYHWEARASSFGLDDLYSWQASKSAKASPDDWVISMLRHRVRLMQRSGGDYWTENVEGEGVFISERGAGNVLYLTSDGGWEWTPPQQYTLTLTGLITGSGGSEVRIYARVGYNDTGAELGGVETAGVEYQYSYEHGGSDIPVIIVVFHTEYDPVWQHYDLAAADASLPINQGFDRVYANP